MKKILITENLLLVLNENYSGDYVFHQTTINNVLKILNTNSFKLSTNLGTNSDRFADLEKHYYFSTSYDRDNHFFSSMGDFYCILVLDYNLMKNIENEKVDYWNHPNMDEKEIRFFSETPYIRNAISYIKQIDILLPSEFENKIDGFKEWKYKKDGYNDEEIQKMRGNRRIVLHQSDENYVRILKSILLMSKKNNIKLNFYLDRKNFQFGLEPDIKIKDFLSSIQTIKPEKPSFYNYKNHFYTLPLLLYYYFNPYDKMDKKNQDRLYRYLFSDLALRDFIISVKNDIHNNKSTSAPILDKLASLLKKENLSLNDFIKKVIADKQKEYLKYHGE